MQNSLRATSVTVQTLLSQLQSVARWPQNGTYQKLEGEGRQDWGGKVVVKVEDKQNTHPPCDTQGCVSGTHQASRSSLSSCMFSLTSTVNSSYCSFSHLVHLQAGQTCMTVQDFKPDRPKTECELMTLHVVLTSFPVFVTNYVSSVDRARNLGLMQTPLFSSLSVPHPINDKFPHCPATSKNCISLTESGHTLPQPQGHLRQVHSHHTWLPPPVSQV